MRNRYNLSQQESVIEHIEAIAREETIDTALEVIDKDLNDYIDFACKNAPSDYEESARVLLAGALSISKAAVLKLKEVKL